ncbi:MAG: Gfo/Idh/MocA family oxidoreductase [Alphaproteobacteria bacterium]|nr:Gfo/Idh/MocA family oxidoreductase [Alphaproteobacteria bacterium]MBU1516096.1 Gfo/Idh/MocA family oxidoreductase [Alphaproteobacteria bacterium]MBU2092689.1 Gfo/Idh/MocA family oxidoreductase [Alphaproteobacteria bacterium]MBU2153786.1 Gfo/Idh/MocA family oxidoreductase [Alphaproteobacteria bacterium]MBU2308414.1 Gfo/Idh/MocA family oxidoreductase [Alphaproteobacteria bacterium]
MADRVLRLGVVGLSRGFDLTRATLTADPRVELVAAADPRAEARAAFQAEFGAPAFATADALLADPAVEVVYIAAPHQAHLELAAAAARAGKHILVEKPMALSLADCRAMTQAAHAAGVHLLVGPSHGFDPPVAWAADFIASGAFGRPRMVTATTFTDFLYRPRRPEELDTAQGGGVIFSQAAHQVDVVRRLIGASVASVRATTGVWDAARPTEGAYQAFLTFDGGASAALTYSGYGRYDTDALMGWVGETGGRKDPEAYAVARGRLETAAEDDLKAARAYGAGAAKAAPPVGHEHFGLVIVACEGGDLRLTATGVEIYGPQARRTVELPLAAATRHGVIDELWAAIVEGQPPRHDGAWGTENLTVCLAILRSAAEGREVAISEIEDFA